MEYLTIKNWTKHQHYKDRNPPWIKLHNTLMEDYDFDCLQDASKLLLILIWLFASKLGEQNPRIPNDPSFIKKKLPIKGSVNLKPLIDSGFLILEQDASRPLADRKQDAITEGEEEEEGEGEAYNAGEFFEVDWKSYPRKAGSKNKAKSCYLKSVNTAEKRIKYLEKTREYIAKTDPNFLKYGETWFRGWEDHHIDDSVKMDKQRKEAATSGGKKLAQIARLADEETARKLIEGSQ